MPRDAGQNKCVQLKSGPEFWATDPTVRRNAPLHRQGSVLDLHLAGTTTLLAGMHLRLAIPRPIAALAVAEDAVNLDIVDKGLARFGPARSKKRLASSTVLVPRPNGGTTDSAPRRS